ncbi:hypothetical protein H4R35_001060 [Dimargaris xerosporica]|nr:hypothetical protein H4R35_001060 [Dimargaris xerosporica]
MKSKKTHVSKWAFEEDRQLLRCVKKYGPRRWNLVARWVGTRSVQQCRRRWEQIITYLGPEVLNYVHVIEDRPESASETTTPIRNDATQHRPVTLAVQTEVAPAKRKNHDAPQTPASTKDTPKYHTVPIKRRKHGVTPTSELRAAYHAAATTPTGNRTVPPDTVSDLTRHGSPTQTPLVTPATPGTSSLAASTFRFPAPSAPVAPSTMDANPLPAASVALASHWQHPLYIQTLSQLLLGFADPSSPASLLQRCIVSHALGLPTQWPSQLLPYLNTNTLDCTDPMVSDLRHQCTMTQSASSGLTLPLRIDDPFTSATAANAPTGVARLQHQRFIEEAVTIAQNLLSAGSSALGQAHDVENVLLTAPLDNNHSNLVAGSIPNETINSVVPAAGLDPLAHLSLFPSLDLSALFDSSTVPGDCQGLEVTDSSLEISFDYDDDSHPVDQNAGHQSSTTVSDALTGLTTGMDSTNYIAALSPPGLSRLEMGNEARDDDNDDDDDDTNYEAEDDEDDDDELTGSDPEEVLCDPAGHYIDDDDEEEEEDKRKHSSGPVPSNHSPLNVEVLLSSAMSASGTGFASSALEAPVDPIPTPSHPLSALNFAPPFSKSSGDSALAGTSPTALPLTWTSNADDPDMQVYSEFLRSLQTANSGNTGLSTPAQDLLLANLDPTGTLTHLPADTNCSQEADSDALAKKCALSPPGAAEPMNLGSDAAIDPTDDEEYAYQPQLTSGDMNEECRQDFGTTISKREYAELYRACLAEMADDLEDTEMVKESADQTLFTKDQMQTLRRQMCQNFQLVTQAYLLETATQGVTTPVATHWHKQMEVLQQLHVYGRAVSTNHFASFCTIPGADQLVSEANALASHLRRIHGFSLPGSGRLGQPLPCASPHVSPWSLPASASTNPKATHHEESKALLDFQRNFRRPVRRRVKSAESKWVEHQPEPLALPRSLADFLSACAPLFDPVLLPQICSARYKSRVMYFPCEDRLLFLGLRYFGLENWDTIRSHLLPTKSNAQLEIRVSNLKSRRIPDNAIKRFMLLQVKPFTLEEEEMLRHGVRIFGRRFKTMSRELIKNRPSFALREAWSNLSAIKSSRRSLGFPANLVSPSKSKWPLLPRDEGIAATTSPQSMGPFKALWPPPASAPRAPTAKLKSRTASQGRSAPLAATRTLPPKLLAPKLRRIVPSQPAGINASAPRDGPPPPIAIKPSAR